MPQSESRPAIRTVCFPLIPPSSKNMWQVSPKGHIYLDQKAKKQREALILYLKSLTPIGEEWSVRMEVGVDIAAGETTVTLIPLELWDKQKVPDTDGIVTSILDSCQPCRYRRGRLARPGAGIIKDDNRIRQLWVEVK